LETPVKVALVGLRRRSIQTLVGIFKQRFQGRFVLGIPATARVAVFNMDCANAGQVWRTFRHKHPDTRVVIIAREPPCLEDVEYVPVPISVRALEQALERAAAAGKTALRPRKSAAATRPTKSTRTGTRPVAAARMRTRPGVANVRRAVDQAVYFQPRDYLFGRLRHALSTNAGKAVLLRCGDVLVAANKSRNKVFVNFPQTRWPALAANQLPAGTASEVTVLDDLDPGAPLPGASRVYKYVLDRFMWDLAVATASGRVAEGTPLDAPVYLRRWPNFTRVAPPDDAMRIAAVWVQQPRSLLNLYQTLKVPVENVFTLYTAAQAIGLAGLARRESDTLIAPAVVTASPYGNLVNAVLNRFVRADKADAAA
jgi:hypothetical protein